MLQEKGTWPSTEQQKFGRDWIESIRRQQIKHC